MNKEKIHKIYVMDLHEKLGIGNRTFVIRVPGGWIYRTEEDKKEGNDTAVFVPLCEYDRNFGKTIATRQEALVIAEEDKELYELGQMLTATTRKDVERIKSIIIRLGLIIESPPEGVDPKYEAMKADLDE